MTRLFNRARAAMLLCALATPAVAADFNTPLNLPSGAVIDMTVTKSVELESRGRTEKFDETITSRQALTATSEGYRVVQTITDRERPSDAPMINPVLEFSRAITFDADKTLRPLRVVDLDALIDDAVRTIGEVVAAVGTAEQRETVTTGIRKSYQGVTPEVAVNAFLREQALLSTARATPLDLGKPVGARTETPSPFGGAPLIKTVSFELKSKDDKTQTAVIEYADVTDPESLKVMVMDGLAKLRPDAPQPSAQDLAAMKLEQSVNCRYDVDLKTGLVSKAVCDVARSVLDPSGQPDRRVEHIVITQRLERP